MDRENRRKWSSKSNSNSNERDESRKSSLDPVANSSPKKRRRIVIEDSDSDDEIEFANETSSDRSRNSTDSSADESSDEVSGSSDYDEEKEEEESSESSEDFSISKAPKIDDESSDENENANLNANEEEIDQFTAVREIPPIDVDLQDDRYSAAWRNILMWITSVRDLWSAKEVCRMFRLWTNDWENAETLAIEEFFDLKSYNLDRSFIGRGSLNHLNQLQSQIFDEFGVGPRLRRFSMIGRCGLRYVLDKNLIKKLVENCPNLQEFRLEYVGITLDAFDVLRLEAQWPLMKNFALNFVETIQLEEGSWVQRCPNLAKNEKILQKFPHVETLELSGLQVQGVLSHLFSNADDVAKSNLKRLIWLLDSSTVSCEDLMQKLAQKCDLTLEFLTFTSANGFPNPSPTFSGHLGTFVNLMDLRINDRAVDNYEITVQSVEQLASRLQNLKRFDYCATDTTRHFRLLEAFAAGFHNLQEFGFRCPLLLTTVNVSKYRTCCTFAEANKFGSQTKEAKPWVIAIKSIIARNPELQTLKLVWNGFSLECLEAILNGFKASPFVAESLEILQIANPKGKSAEVEALVEKFEEFLPNLRQLVIGHQECKSDRKIANFARVSHIEELVLSESWNIEKIRTKSAKKKNEEILVNFAEIENFSTRRWKILKKTKNFPMTLRILACGSHRLPPESVIQAMKDELRKVHVRFVVDVWNPM